jgi:hypothetical protein
LTELARRYRRCPECCVARDETFAADAAATEFAESTSMAESISPSAAVPRSAPEGDRIAKWTESWSVNAAAAD